MFADDLVVVGNGKLLAAESVEALTARGAVTVVVETPQPADLTALLGAHDLTVESVGDRLHVRNTTAADVSQIAFDHGIRVIEITENDDVPRRQPARPHLGLRRVRIRLNLTPAPDNPKDHAMTTTTLTATPARHHPAVRSRSDDLASHPRSVCGASGSSSLPCGRPRS